VKGRALAAEDAREVDAMLAAVLALYSADPERAGVRATFE